MKPENSFLFRNARHWSIPWTSRPYPLYLRSILILSSYLRVGLPSVVFLQTCNQTALGQRITSSFLWHVGHLILTLSLYHQYFVLYFSKEAERGKNGWQWEWFRIYHVTSNTACVLTNIRGLCVIYSSTFILSYISIILLRPRTSSGTRTTVSETMLPAFFPFLVYLFTERTRVRNYNRNHHFFQ